MRSARRALVLGIGGGGDVVGALAVARMCEAMGTDFVLGGVTWERFAVDPHPGPRRIDEIRGGRPLAETALLADERTTTPEGTPFAEAGMARHLGASTVLVDPSGGPGPAADGIVAAATALECDLAIYVDVGGDVLARGDEPGLSSPLCDAVMLAAANRATSRVGAAGAVFGPGCDGELTVEEVLGAIAELAGGGAWLGTWGLTHPVAAELEAAAKLVPTEASLLPTRCFRGESGEVEIRGGRRRVLLTPVGALAFFFDVAIAQGRIAPLARAVADAGDLEAANAALNRLGVRTELDYERERVREPDHGDDATPGAAARTR